MKTNKTCTYLTNGEIRSLVAERQNNPDASVQYLAWKYKVSTDTVYSYLKSAKDGTLEERLKKHQKGVTKRLRGITKIRDYEDRYTRFRPCQAINKFYVQELKIGDNIDLDPNTARREINKLMSFLIGDSFEKEYGREFNIVDLYLTTNLSIRGLCEKYQDLMTILESKRILMFLQQQLLKVDNVDIFSSGMYCKQNTYLRFTRPAEKRINNILNQDFFTFNNITASKEDVYNAYQVLLDLNEKYGVKCDEISFYMIIEVYMAGQVDTFYQLGEKYKEQLDQKTHVQKRCIPLLTRRENNR